MSRPRGAPAARAGFCLLAAALFVLPYFQEPWWQFCHSTVALVLLWLGAFGRSGPARLGLRMTRRGASAALLVFAALFALVGLEQRWIAESLGWTRTWHHFPECADPFFQALNEELLLGYVPLFWLARRTGRPHLSTSLLAVAFALLHVTFYAFIWHGPKEWLAGPAVATLFLAAICRNYLILAAGHVGFAAALHGAWNLWFFGGQWRGDRPIDEVQLFSVFLGRPAVLLSAAATAVAALLIYIPRSRP